MDVHTEGEDSYPATYKPSDWTPIIRAYKDGKPNPQTQVVPSQSVPVSAKPTASTVGAPADAAPASFKPSYRAQQQHLSVAHAVALRGKQLPLLPPGTIRVVFRPRGGLALNGAMAQPLMRALQGTAAGRDLGELHLRIHPTNNTFTVATSHETTALHLVQLKELVLQTTTYPVAAYIAPPPAAVRGMISQAYWEETPEQMLQDLQTRNPDADIIAARRMGRTLPILITFAHGPVPHTMRYMSVVYRCTQYKGSPDACTNCRQPGHRYDVCPPPQKWPLLTHLTGTGSCKARNPTAKRRSPPPQKTKLPGKEDFPPPRQDPPIYVCMVLRGHQGEQHDLPRLGGDGSAGRALLALAFYLQQREVLQTLTRNTPNSVTGRTPAELFLKRQPRVKLSLLKPSFVHAMRSRQDRDATHRNEDRGRDPQMEAGDAVFVKTTRGEPLSWEEAVLVQRVSDSTFVVKVGLVTPRL
ncbi:hypothetical protein MTO96_024888 [Rhipicephalus appendiculatus]